jgi:hypothetical protein
MSIVTVNGTPQVFNNIILSVNGSTDVEINGYILSIDWDTGSLTDYVQTMSPTATTLIVNPINGSNTATIRIANGYFPTFYGFLNNRFSAFTLNFNNYTSGDLGGASQPLIIKNCKIDQQSGTSSAQSAANVVTLKVKATEIIWI